jgi:hypothetical protein
MDEASLIEKLRRVEALFAGATTEGERDAAEHARRRILDRLRQWEREEPPVEYRFSMADMWSRKVFVALLRRYEILPYRYRGQRYTTVMARLTRRFVDETLWPEFTSISQALGIYLAEVTERVVHEVIHGDSSEAEVVRGPEQLSTGLEPPVGPTPKSDPRSRPASAEGTRVAGSGAPDRVEKGHQTAKGRRSKKRKRRKRR